MGIWLQETSSPGWMTATPPTSVPRQGNYHSSLSSTAAEILSPQCSTHALAPPALPVPSPGAGGTPLLQALSQQLRSLIRVQMQAWGSWRPRTLEDPSKEGEGDLFPHCLWVVLRDSPLSPGAWQEVNYDGTYALMAKD